MKLPRLYPIVDVGTLQARGVELGTFARQLVEGGAEILQLRDKDGSPEQILREAGEIASVLQGTNCLPVMNDRVDLALLAGWHAVHLGHKDLPPAAARQVYAGRELLIGVSTHNQEQMIAADAGSADYVAVGPVFATGTKRDAEPVIGLEAVRQARRLTRKPLVAIGGITRQNAAAVIEAGADSVAVIGGLFSGTGDVAAVTRDFLRLLR